jgi:hypothetical protein
MKYIHNFGGETSWIEATCKTKNVIGDNIKVDLTKIDFENMN